MPETPMVAEQPDQDQVEQYDAIVIGAGISGIFMLYRLRELGMTTRVFESGTNVRRHLVLEPLSWRPLRFRKLDLWLFVFQGVDAGMGLEGAFLPPT